MIEKIKDSEIKEKSMSSVSTRPNSTGLYREQKMTPSELKERMDALALLAIDKINELICGMQVGGDVAKTIRFKNGEEGVEYSLEELFSMIFEPEGLSNLLKTSIEITENGEQKSLPLNTALNDIVSLAKSLEDDVNLIKKSKSIALSTNEFDKSKLPSKIYYKVIEPEWVNTVVVADKNQQFEVSKVSYATEEIEHTWEFWTVVIPANSYYFWDSVPFNPQEGFPSYSPLFSYTLNNERVMCDSNGKIIYVYSENECSGINESEEWEGRVTYFRYADGSPVEAPLTLYPAEIVECYDFENLQFTTEAEGNTLLGDVYTYRNEWNGRNYTLYPDYTPNIAEGQSAISLAISDPEKMLYSIKLEALFNGGYTFSLGNKDFAYLGGVDVVADGDGAVASGKKTFVIGNGASGFGVLNKVRARNATSFGYNNTVTGVNGVAFNEGNKILAYAALGLGDHNTVGGSYDIIGGFHNKSKGCANLGQGSKNIIKGNYILGLGNSNVVKGICNIMQGYRNESDGKYNNMNGFNNKSKGNSNIVNGNYNNVNSSYNEVFGVQNTIIETSTFNVINGQNNKINAPSSVNNLIIGVGNIVEPSPYAGTKNYGYNVLVGRHNISRSTYGIAYGANLIVDGTLSQLVLGSYNEIDRYARIIVGNGGSDTKRSNAFVVKNDGRAVLGADPKENMDAVTKQYLDEALKEYASNDMIGDTKTALDAIIAEQKAIIAIQNKLIGGDSK